MHSCGRIGEFSPQYSVPVLIGESNVAIVPAIGGYGVEDIYLGEFSPHLLVVVESGRYISRVGRNK